MAVESKAAGTAWLKAQTKRMSEGHELTISEAQAAGVVVERWLQEHKVEYAPPTDIPMSMIDERSSRANQARATPIVPESVDRFALAMKAGAVFPPIVVYPKAGKLVIIDGNNRQAAAARVGLETISGIVISDQTPGELVQLLTVGANAHHGVTPDLQWRLRQAFHLVMLGFTDAQAADECGVTTQQISNARRVQEADAKARDLKILGFTDLPSTSRGLLGTIKDDAVFSRASRLVISSGMTTEEVRDMNRKLKNLSSERARLETLEELAEDHGLQTQTRKALGGKVPTRATSAKSLLISGSGIVLRCDEHALAKSIVTEHDATVIERRLAQLEEKILAIRIAMEAGSGS